MEEHQIEKYPVSGSEEELEQPTNTNASVTKSLRNRKRTAKRKRMAQSKKKQTADPSGNSRLQRKLGKRKRPANEQPEGQATEEPTLLLKFIDDDARKRFEWISQKGFITQKTIIPYEFRQGKTPTTEEEIKEDDDDDDDDDEDTEEEDPAQFRLARRRPGSSKITI
nr:zinc finger CCCH domain-containing protein 15 homolog [Coffea arabica]